MSDLAPAMVGMFFFAMVGFIVKIISDNSLRKRMIERGMSGEEVKTYLSTTKIDFTTNPIASVKWGLISISVGIAIFAGMIVSPDDREYVTAGLLFLLSGISLVAFYIFANKQSKKD